jgi:hypothetical protein
MAAVAADPGADLGAVRDESPALHAALALLMLLAATVLVSTPDAEQIHRRGPRC